MICSRIHRCIGPLLTLGLSLTMGAAVLFAQPSGGPYGPVQRHYELPATGRIWFVAPTGQPPATGSRLTEPTDLATALAQAATGETIVLRGGLYRTGGLRFNQGITLQPYADERPVLTGTEVAVTWEVAGEGRWRTRWTRLFPAAPADWWPRNERNLSRSPLCLFNDDMVFVDDQLLRAVGSLAEVTPDSYYIDYANAWVYLGRDPTDRRVEITAHNSALVRTTRTLTGRTNDGRGPTIRGLTFTRYARLALLVEGTEPGAYMTPDHFGKEIVGTTLEDLTISFCSRVAGYFRGDGLTIRHCLVADCGTEGIYVINSANVLLEGNIVTRTNSAENLAGYFATAVKIFNQSYNVVCRDNLIIDNPNASGVWYDVGNVDGVFVNNWVETTDNGFFFEISKGAICAGNVFVNCGTGVRVLNSSNVQVAQNTFFNSTAAFQRSGRTHRNDDHFGWHTSAGPDVTEREGHTLINNLLVGDVAFSGPWVSFWQQDTVNDLLKSPQVRAFDGNVYVRRSTGTGSAPPPLVAWSPSAAPTGQDLCADLDAVRTLTPPFELHGQDFSDYWGPLFRGEALHHFELLAAFPGAHTATPLPEAISDLLGRTRGSAGYPGAYAPR